MSGALRTPRLASNLEVSLSEREGEVLRQMTHGLTNKQIAQTMNISYETVKEHVQHVLRKIGLTDRTQAAVWAVRNDLLYVPRLSVRAADMRTYSMPISADYHRAVADRHFLVAMCCLWGQFAHFVLGWWQPAHETIARRLSASTPPSEAGHAARGDGPAHQSLDEIEQQGPRLLGGHRQGQRIGSSSSRR